MQQRIQNLKSVAWRFTVWRTKRPDHAAFAFDLSVIALGLLFVGVSTALRYLADNEQTVADRTPTETRKVEALIAPAVVPAAVDPVTASLDSGPAESDKQIRRVLLSRPTSYLVAADGGHEWNRARRATYAASRRLPPVPSPAVFFDAQRRLVTGETQQAAKVFSSLAATYPNDPATAYHLAVALYIAGRQDEAATVAVRAAMLERRYGLPGYGCLMERIQGPHRVWLEQIRRPIVRH